MLIDEVLNLPLVDIEAVKEAKFKVVVDGVNSSGGIIIPKLLKLMGVEVVELYCEPNGHFPHNPEPLKEHLTDISELVVKEKADFGIVVDPDVDRLAFISEDGEMFGEEYTLVACADYVLSKTPGNTVSNMSSSRALRDVTKAHGGSYEASAVGEVNVVELMKKNNVMAVHCPSSNLNVGSGMMPIRKFLDKNIPIALGSDISGGHTSSIFKTMVYAIEVSKLFWADSDKSINFLSNSEAFYLATKGGGSFFGNVGSFEKGLYILVMIEISFIDMYAVT